MAEDDKQHKCPIEGDLVVPIAPTASGGAACFVHTKDHGMSIGEMQPMRPGVSVPDEARFVECHDGKWTIHESIAELKGGQSLKAGAGPAQVATEEYRESWERTFGKQRVGLA